MADELEMHVLVSNTVIVPASQFAKLTGMRSVSAKYNGNRYEYTLSNDRPSFEVLSGPEVAAMIAVKRLTEENET